MARFHVNSIQEWESFSYADVTYSLSHLKAHKVSYVGQNHTFNFVVTYGLHCFTKRDTPYNIPLNYPDGKESLPIDLERYQASKSLKKIITNLTEFDIYHTSVEKFFTLDKMSSATGKIEPYKVALVFFKENRLMRIHVTSAFFARTGEGSVGVPVNKKPQKLFKIALDVSKRPRSMGYPKEVRNLKPN